MASGIPRLGYEETLTDHEGKKILLRASKIPLRDTTNEVIGVMAIYEDISERKEMENNLYMASSAIKESRNSFFWIGPAGDVKYANDFACQNLGYARNELIGMHVWDFDPDFKPENQGPFWQDIKRDGMYVLESRHRRKDGTIFPVEIASNFIASDNEELVFCSVRDITDRKQAEQRLRLTQFAIDHTSVEVYQLDADGRILYVNQQACRSLGYSAEELQAMTISDIDPFYQDEVWRAHWQSLRNLKSLSFESMHKRKDGTVFPVEISANYVKYGDREYNFAFTHDITERKHAEEEVRLAATTFESQEGIIITDAEETILRVNQAFTTITGYTAEEVVGHKPSMLKSGRHDADFYWRMHDALKANGVWQGEIWDRHKDGHIYPKSLTISAVKNASGNVSHYVSGFTDISERKAAEEEIYNLAFYDTLTKLPNRRLLNDRLEQSLTASKRSGQYGALLYLDLDNFKHLNDTKGHHYGDFLLFEVASRLKACVREEDTVARLGGDEFVVILDNLDDNADGTVMHAKLVSDKILAALNAPYALDGYVHHASASIGITLFHWSESRREELLTQADMAMYEAKKAGRNTQRFFDPVMQQTLDARVTLEAALRQALPNQEFKLFYQLQVDDQTHPVGVEALIRWMHPERGLVPPVQFIPLAEEIRLIVPIGQWVLETACAQLKAWEKVDVAKDLTIAINISALHFQQDNFVDEVHAVASSYGISSGKLKLELTEGVVLEDMKDAIAKIERLQALGFILSMDDFGTGYSSLSYLRRLPFNQLKIDRSFIMHALENPNDAFIITMVTAMGERFGMDVIAEGVETSQQHQHLLSLGCKAFQGYFFGRPMPIEELEASLTPG